MNLDQALETYVDESRELLGQMEDALLRFAQGSGDPEEINALFRAAHTIKGSAGLFGLDDIVAFTHTVESVLDRVRDGDVALDAGLATLLLDCCDHMAALVNAAAPGGGASAADPQAGADIQRQLGAYLATGPQAAATGPAATTAANDPPPSAEYWHLSLRFGPDVLRNGMDPFSFIRFLATIGDIVAMTTMEDALPPADEMDPESCYLGFEIGLRSGADKATIEGVFDFVREDCRIRLLPPTSKAREYVEHLRTMQPEDERLGQMLVRCGALTRDELAAALQAQDEPVVQTQGPAVPARPLGEILLDQQVVREPVVRAALDRQRQVKDTRAQESRFIRLDAEKVDLLINRIGELVIAGAGISLAAKRVGAAELLEAASVLATLVEDVRDGALNLRMVQIGATFARFQRVVHDVSKELGKDIELVVSGAETELDKTMVERIGDPLMHLVRNAMDHGIEPTQVRLERGKPARGTLRLDASHDSGSVVIEVADDGGGLDRERVLAKAIERGLVQADQVLTDREVWNLIFEPGFSTAEKITNLSGRGVGMDVVKRSVTDLRGTVEVDSRAGMGTTIRIRLPLTLAIIDGFLVRVGESVFVVPLDMVEECIELTAAARAETSGRRFVNLRGKVLPFIELRDMFDIEGERSRRENILVVRFGEERAGLVVDELLGEAQTVIKPLSRIFAAVRGISGSTILGGGDVALILDVPRLLAEVQGRTEGLSAAA
jgi:two-component system chemotaxis sensor kinase CheA